MSSMSDNEEYSKFNSEDKNKTNVNENVDSRSQFASVDSSQKVLINNKDDTGANSYNDSDGDAKVNNHDKIVNSNEGGADEGISFFDKYLTVWVFLCMIIGGVIGALVPDSSKDLEKAAVYGINIIIAVLLWFMILPMLVQIDFETLKAVRKAPGAIALTTSINYLIKPFTMYAIALLFFRVFYVTVIPKSDLRDSYIAGLILLACAPCTAMVFVWSVLVHGDGAYTLVQVAFNDLLMLALYAPTCILLIGVSNIELPYLTIIYAVLLFIVAPLIIAFFIRTFVVRYYGVDQLNAWVAKTKPVTISFLLCTLVLIFVFQGAKIASKPLDMVLIAIPIIIQCVLNFFVAYQIGFHTCIEHSKLAPASMIATSNFFELAVAVAVSVYGVDSGATLATVVGVLVEVPVMLTFTYYCNWRKPALDLRCAQCPDVCPMPVVLVNALNTLCCIKEDSFDDKIGDYDTNLSKPYKSKASSNINNTCAEGSR